MRRIGFVVNPVAGMGGRVGLKGTDGMVEEARARGAEPRAPDRAVEALIALRERARVRRRQELQTAASSDDERSSGDGPSEDEPPEGLMLLTAGAPMGETEARTAGFEPEIVYDPTGPTDAADAETTGADTRVVVRELIEHEVDLILFVGGDGTAVDVAETLEGTEIPMLGVPAGVKVYSSVFAVTPETAGRIAADADGTEPREVNDIDEEAYREGEVRAELRAIATVPVSRGLQSSKQLSGGSVESLAHGIAAEIDPEVTYVFGPGSTVGAICEQLGFEASPLGVDVWKDDEVLVRDGSERDILDALGENNEIVVSPVGGQGFVFGRGNHQLSPAVIRQSTVTIVASRRKLDGVGVLRVDTDDEELNESLRGWHRVRVGRFEERLVKIV